MEGSEKTNHEGRMGGEERKAQSGERLRPRERIDGRQKNGTESRLAAKKRSEKRRRNVKLDYNDVGLFLKEQ